jgi:RNA polymerase sigma factor (sigma-70 family)
MALSESGIGGPRQFPETSWSAILKLRDSKSPEYGRSLARLAELYWRPVYQVIRHGWARDHDVAKDLTQEFFASVVLGRDLFRDSSPQIGSFRSLVRAALTNFLRNVVRDGNRLKRGGGAHEISLHVVDHVPELAAGLSPEDAFDAAWNDLLLSRALGELDSTLTASGRKDWFAAFRRRDLADGPPPSYEALAEELGWTVRKVRRVLTETRALLRSIAARIVREYVGSPAEMSAELETLFGE